MCVCVYNLFLYTCRDAVAGFVQILCQEKVKQNIRTMP